MIFFVCRRGKRSRWDPQEKVEGPREKFGKAISTFRDQVEKFEVVPAYVSPLADYCGCRAVRLCYENNAPERTLAFELVPRPTGPQNRRHNCHPLRSLSAFPSQKSPVTVLQVLNKVAGVYGLIAVLTGAGGSFAQLSLYIYSVLGLIALGWGLQVVKAVRLRMKHFDQRVNRRAH